MTDRQIRTVREHEVYRNELVTVFDDEVVFPGGRAGHYVRVDMVGEGTGVVLLPTHAGRVALVRTYRYPIATQQWALPRGLSHGADVMTTARVELREELGVTDATLAILGHVTPDSGLLSSRVAIVHATLTSASLAPADTEEVSESRWLTADEITAQIASGRLEDGFTLAALALARALRVFG
jgi:ADP-ribose pyrophosphatase